MISTGGSWFSLVDRWSPHGARKVLYSSDALVFSAKMRVDADGGPNAYSAKDPDGLAWIEAEAYGCFDRIEIREVRHDHLHSKAGQPAYKKDKTVAVEGVIDNHLVSHLQQRPYVIVDI